jgi:hypothetical protein
MFRNNPPAASKPDTGIPAQGIRTFRLMEKGQNVDPDEQNSGMV